MGTQAISLGVGQQCPYCRQTAHGYGANYASSSGQAWPPQPPPAPAAPYPPAGTASYSTSPQAGYYATSAGPSYGSLAAYTGYGQPASAYQSSPSPTHMEYAIAHSNQQNQCPTCHKVLGRNADLDRHINSVHLKVDQYECTYETCDRHGRPFNRYDHLRDHLRKVHGEHLPKTRGPRSSRNQ